MRFSINQSVISRRQEIFHFELFAMQLTTVFNVKLSFNERLNGNYEKPR